MVKCETHDCHSEISLDDPYQSIFCDHCLASQERALRVGIRSNLPFDKLTIYVQYVTSRFPSTTDTYLTE